MASVDSGPRAFGNPWRVLGWGAAGGLLLLPLVAMQFSDEVQWGPEDFVFAAVLIGAVGLGLELAVRRSRNLAYRAGVAVALGAAFLMTWANAAVGIIGAEDNPINGMFTDIVLLALFVSAIARFRPRGLAIGMAVVAVAQLAAAIIGFGQDVRGALLSGFFVAMWVLAALLFREAARRRS